MNQKAQQHIFHFFSTLTDAVIVGAHAAVGSIPAIAIAEGRVDPKTSILVGAFTGLTAMLRYLKRARDIQNGG